MNNQVRQAQLADGVLAAIPYLHELNPLHI